MEFSDICFLMMGDKNNFDVFCFVLDEIVLVLQFGLFFGGDNNVDENGVSDKFVNVIKVVDFLVMDDVF